MINSIYLALFIFILLSYNKFEINLRNSCDCIPALPKIVATLAAKLVPLTKVPSDESMINQPIYEKLPAVSLNYSP